MSLNPFAILHPLDKTTDTPPTWMQGKEFEDGLGNTLKLVKHNTPSAGVAVTAGSPVGYLAANKSEKEVTTDLSQSNIGLLAGMSLVAITAAESLAAETWAWIMTKGRPSDYAAGGPGVPLGDSSSSFNNNNPLTSLKTDNSVAANDGLYWQADDTWGGKTEPADGEVLGGRALDDDGGTTMDPAEVIIDVGIGMGYTA